MSLIESLVSLALTLTITAAALSVLTPAARASAVQPEMSDVQQRGRAALEMIVRDVASAGSGVAAPVPAGLIVRAIPALLPRRLGATGDGPAVARADAISIISIPSASPQTTTAGALAAGATSLTVNAPPNCGSTPLCGLTVGDDVLVMEGAQFDTFRITAVNGSTAAIRPHGGSSSAYPAGAIVTRVETTTYYLDTASGVLRQTDGDQSDQPAVDHVTMVAFEFWGDGGDGALTPIPLATLGDGPWLGAGRTTFDADLLRVRAVRVSLTAAAANPALVSRVGPFALWADVAPRSLAVGR